jgi:hypothetical protein
LPKKNAEVVLATDASEFQVGCVLLQIDGNSEHPLGYYSRLLNAAETRYSATEREGLAVVWACRLLRHHLVSRYFVIRTDHASLQWLLTGTSGSENARLTRWRLRLSDLNFSVQHRAGATNHAADALSRLTTTEYDTRAISADIPCLTISATDAEMVRVLQHLPDPIRIEELVSEQLKYRTEMMAVNHTFEDEDGMWVRMTATDQEKRIVVPSSMQQRVLKLHHDSLTAGHPGAKRLYSNISRNFYWQGLTADCYSYVARCLFCIKKSLRLQQKTTALTLFPPQRPFEMVGIDLLGPLAQTSRGNVYILVITDRFSKVTRAVPMTTDTTAASVALSYFCSWVSYYGAPLALLSDNGPPFRSKLFRSFNLALGTHCVFTTAYRPQVNGQTERFNRTLLDMIRAFVVEHPADWDILLPFSSLAYNNTVHSSTGLSPNEIVVPSGLRLPMVSPTTDFDLPSKFSSPLAYRQQVLRLAEQHGKACRETNAQRAARYKRAYDLRVQPRTTIHTGDYVFVKSMKPSGSKLLYPVTGPHRVVSVRGPVLTVETNAGTQTINADRCARVPEEEVQPIDAEALLDVPTQQEFVIDRVVAHGTDPETGSMLVRIRWHGFSAEDDTWENPKAIPRHFVESYARRKRMRVGRFIDEATFSK